MKPRFFIVLEEVKHRAPRDTQNKQTHAHIKKVRKNTQREKRKEAKGQANANHPLLTPPPVRLTPAPHGDKLIWPLEAAATRCGRCPDAAAPPSAATSSRRKTRWSTCPHNEQTGQQHPTARGAGRTCASQPGSPVQSRPSFQRPRQGCHGHSHQAYPHTQPAVPRLSALYASRIAVSVQRALFHAAFSVFTDVAATSVVAPSP